MKVPTAVVGNQTLTELNQQDSFFLQPNSAGRADLLRRLVGLEMRLPAEHWSQSTAARTQVGARTHPIKGIYGPYAKPPNCAPA